MNSSRFSSIFSLGITVFIFAVIVGFTGCREGSDDGSASGEEALTAWISSPGGDANISEGDAVNFLGSATGGKQPLSFSWDFDGGVSNSLVLESGSVTFAKAGTYTVTFTVQDANGNTSSASRKITVDVLPPYIWYADSDGDGYGNPDSSKRTSEKPEGYVDNKLDSDDSDPSIYPGAPEVCGDGKDNDSDGWIDEGCTGYAISGVIRYQGIPIFNVKPTFWFMDESTGNVFENAAYSYDTNTGNYEIMNLPGKMAISIYFRPSASEFDDYFASIRVDESNKGTYDIETQKYIHVIAPWDNAKDEFSSKGPYPTYTSQITYRWEDLPGATHYWLFLKTGSVYVKGTEYTDNPAPSDTPYSFRIQAYKGDLLIGNYRVHYKEGGSGSQNYFMIK